MSGIQKNPMTPLIRRNAVSSSATGPMFGSVADDPPFLSPEWLALFDAACADAEELGFTLWLYDQIGFSGANFQGRLIAAEPGFAGQALYRTEREGTDVSVTAPAGHDPLAAYAVLENGERVAVPLEDGAARWVGPPARVTLVHAGTSGFDYFSRQACAALLDQVHGTLEKAVGHWFGRSVGGFFQDELPPMPTWGRDFAATFADEYGYDLRPRLWALWEPDPSAEAARMRHDYHAHRATLARRGFFDQHDAWFADRGLVCGFDQASPAREGDPVGGVHTYGDYLGLHRGYGAPGSDHWGDAKVHSSLAHANGYERVWIEAFHSSAGAARSRRPTTGSRRSCAAAPPSTTRTPSTTPPSAAGGSGRRRPPAGASRTGRPTRCSPRPSRASAPC